MSRYAFVLLTLIVFSIVISKSAQLPAAEVALEKGFTEVSLNGHKFKLPLGFEISLCVAPSVVPRPITAAFDDQGRLYVADSSGSNEKSTVQLEKKPHRILRLEDKDGDGKFEHSTVFADNMMLPEGTMWLDGSLYVAAPPSIWKLTDKDGDGIAEDRVEWFQGKTLTGCANDLHGPYAGPDGFIYWCKGAFAKQEYKQSGSSPLSTKASHIFRSKPDGTAFEHVMTGGMDNPVDVTFTSSGERIFTTTFFQHPANGLRDGLIHAVYGGIYGKVHDVLNDQPWTSPEVMPVLSHLGAAAPSGLHAYESNTFGKEYTGNVFACLFNMHKVTRHQLHFQGAGLASNHSDFLVSDQIDFHPTDVIEDADGSLIIIDTGGWYKLCCPTSQLVKPDINGAIYRVRKSKTAIVPDPYGLKINCDKLQDADLVMLLADDRPVVRKKAGDVLSKKGDLAVTEILKAGVLFKETVAKTACVWALCKIGSSNALLALQTFLVDPSPDVRIACLNALSLHRSVEANVAVRKLLKDGNLPEQRLSAEILGRIKDKESIPLILSVAGKTNDPILLHSLTYALYEIHDFDLVRAGLEDKSPNVKRVALHALELIEPAKMKVEFVLQDLNNANKSLRDSTWWIVSRHSEWGNSIAPYLQSALDKGNDNPTANSDLFNRLGSLHQATLISGILSNLVSDETRNVEMRKLALRTMASSGAKDPSESWVLSITKAISSNDKSLVMEALKTLKALKLSSTKLASLMGAVQTIALNNKKDADLRLLAFSIVPSGFKIAEDDFDSLFLKGLATDQLVSNRIFTAEVLSKSKLTKEQMMTLANVFEKASPVEIDRLLDAYAGITEDIVGFKLIAALRKSPSSGSVRVETIKEKLKKLGPEVQKEVEKLGLEIRVQTSRQYEKLEAILPMVAQGNIRNGQAVFQSAKGACIVCHAMGYLGGKVGPDLTKIGQIRSERDLLEAILFPSASFVRSYEPLKIATSSGKIFQGLIKSESPEDIVLITGPDQQTRILRADIEVMEPGLVSVMPAGLEQQFSAQELADLVAFLKASK